MDNTFCIRGISMAESESDTKNFLQGSLEIKNEPLIITPKQEDKTNEEWSCQRNEQEPGKRRPFQHQGSNVFDLIIAKLPTHLTFWQGNKNGAKFISIHRKTADLSNTHQGPISVAAVVIYEDGTGHFVCNGDTKEVVLNNCILEDAAFQQLIGQLGKGYHFCGGIPKEFYGSVTKHLNYKPKHYTEQLFPVPAVRSENCLQWFYSKKPKIYKDTGLKCCPTCCKFLQQARRSDKRNDIPDWKKNQRLNPSSNFPHKFLSQNGFDTRLSNIKKRWHTEMRRKKRALTQRTPDDDQNREMLDNVSGNNDE